MVAFQVDADADLDIIEDSNAGKYGLGMARFSADDAAELQGKLQILKEIHKVGTKGCATNL